MKKSKILVVGGGFAGVALVRKLHQLRAPVEVTLMSEESYNTFNPMLAEVVGATLFPEHVTAPLRELTGQARFIMGTMQSADYAASMVHAETLKGDMEIPYDHLVLAFGSRAHLSLIPGMSDHAHVLKTVGDAMYLRNLVLRRMARMELETDPAVLAALGHFVVIGGGFSGVETAGALIDFLKSIHHYYPIIDRSLLKVTLLHNASVLLPQLPQALGLSAAKSLRSRGVMVCEEAQAVEIGADFVALKDGARINSATVVCTIGITANSLADKLGLPTDRGRIVCRGDLSVHDHPGVWAMGDCALIPIASETPNAAPNFAPATAQFAVAEGKYLGKRINDALAGRSSVDFNYRSRGMMATTGHQKGVAELFGIKLTGLPAWMLWRAYYLSQIPTWGRRVRIFVEWTWGMAFPPDITHFRFVKSSESTEGIDNRLHIPEKPEK